MKNIKNIFTKTKEIETYIVSRDDIRYAVENRYQHSDKVWSARYATEVKCFSEDEAKSVIEAWIGNKRRLGSEGMLGSGLFEADQDYTTLITVRIEKEIIG